MDPAFHLSTFYHAIANRKSLEAITLRYFQSSRRTPGTMQELNLTDVFPAYFTQSVRYLDLSRNDFEAVTGNFIQSFTKLKYWPTVSLNGGSK